MRVCELHRERAVETLVSRRDQVEYDLCEKCVDKLHHILHGEEEVKAIGTRRRGTRKTASVAKT